MDFILIIIACFLSAVFPAALYFYLPFLILYSVIIRRSILLNRITSLYIYSFLIVLVFFGIHSLISGGVQFIFLKGILRYFSYLSFVLYVSTLNRHMISLIFKAVILFFVFSLPLALFQINIIGRYQNIFAHANHFSYVLMICLYFVFRYKVFNYKILPIIIFILLFSLILASSSGAILTVLVLILYHYISRNKRNFVKFLFTSIILFGIVLAISFTDKISSQIESLQYIDFKFIYNKAQLYDPGGYGSFVWRLVYWMQILQSFLSNNSLVLLFGEGIDTLTKDNYLYSFMYTDPHNDYLKILVEFGFIGLSLLFLFLNRIYRIFRRYDILIIFMVPLFFANIIVNWPFNIFIVLYLIFELYSKNDKETILLKQDR